MIAYTCTRGFIEIRMLNTKKVPMIAHIYIQEKCAARVPICITQPEGLIEKKINPPLVTEGKTTDKKQENSKGPP